MKEREGKPGMRFQNSLINFQFSIKNSLRNRTGFQNFSFFPFGSDKLVFSSFFFYNCVPIEDWALVRAHNKEKREWKRDLLPNEEEIVTSVTSHGWSKEKNNPLMRSSFAWFFSFYNQPGLTDGYKWFPLPFPFQWWAWAIVIASRRLSRSSKRKWKPGRHKEERENECMIDLSFLFYLIDHVIIHFSSSFMCLLARLCSGDLSSFH